MFARTLTAAAFCVLLTLPASAEDRPDPYSRADDTWISISGTVAAPTPDSFMLRYGNGVVRVEMDDWDVMGDAYGLSEGDQVTVHGKVDDGFYETTSIEASSIFVRNLNTYFYANSADEEGDGPQFLDMPAPMVTPSSTSVRGRVVNVDEDDGTFTIDHGPNELTVDVSRLTYDPLDDEGFQKIEPDDVVSVSGRMDDGLFSDRELTARSVVTLTDASGS